jgi:hypothetical protein
MGYINIKITDIQVPNDFMVYIKPDNGENKPYPIDTSGGGWTSYGPTTGYSGGTTEIMLSGTTYDFDYGTTYWIKLQELLYMDRFVVKNIRIFDAVAYGAAPEVTPTISVPITTITPSITRTATPTRTVSQSYVLLTPTITPTITPTQTKTPSVTPSIGTSQSRTPSVTPTITPSNLVSEIYFASLTDEIGALGVNNSLGRTFSITFTYVITAEVANDWSMGQDAVQATTYLYISTNGGSSWEEKASVSAEVSGGNYPIEQYDVQSITGTTTLSGITDVSDIRISGPYDCAWTQDIQRGSVDVIITSVSVNTGSAIVICDDKYHVGCLDTPALSCISGPATPTPSLSISKTPTMTPSVSREVLLVAVDNTIGTQQGWIESVTVAGLPITTFWWTPIENGHYVEGESTMGTGTWDVTVSLWGTGPSGTIYMTLIDSTGYVHCCNLPLGETQAIFTNVQINSTGIYSELGGHNVAMLIKGYPGGACVTPEPSRSITPTTTPSLSISKTPGLSPSVTPSTTPLKFGYNILVYVCGISCDTASGSAWIENEFYLSIGYYYKYDDSTIYYITSSASLGGDVTSVSGPGFITCAEACASG